MCRWTLCSRQPRPRTAPRWRRSAGRVMRLAAHQGWVFCELRLKSLVFWGLRVSPGDSPGPGPVKCSLELCRVCAGFCSARTSAL